MERLCIDRFEGDLAVCQAPDGTQQILPRALLPKGSREGDWLLRGDSGELLPDPEETQRRRAQILALQNRLLGRTPPAPTEK